MATKYPRFCDPTVDWAFKRIFGSEQYKDATIGFIRSLLPEKDIQDIKFLNVEIPGFTSEDRDSCVDILCSDVNGNNFIIEMQVVKQDFFRQRTVLYASTLISHFADKGERWNYHIKPLYVISVLDFIMEKDGPENCISHYLSREMATGAVLPGAPEFFFLEPRRFRKTESELKNYQEKWLYLFRHAKSLDVIPEGLFKDKAFDAYFKASETGNMTKEERMNYDRAMITKTDIEYGKLYSFNEGKAEGRLDAQKEVARKLLAKGLPLQEISELTGLPEDVIKSL